MPALIGDILDITHRLNKGHEMLATSHDHTWLALDPTHQEDERDASGELTGRGEGSADVVYECVACAAFVTDQSAAISVAGGHLHQRVNLDAEVFDVRTFSDAPGCFLHGTPTALYSWFEGYRWRFASCAGCGLQLGWGYECGEDGFVGLIAERVREVTTRTG